MIEEIIFNPLFSLVLILASYIFAGFLQKKTKLSILNPLLVSVLIIIGVLLIFDIPLSAFNEGGDIVTMFLAPVTALLALSIYRQRELVKKNFVAILVGTVVGAIVSIGSIIVLANILGLDDRLTSSLVPKSVTTPIALAVSETLGGIPGITVCALILSGLFGNMLAPVLIKLLRLNDPVAAGIAIGSSSHALGTVTALELGEDIGAISSIAIPFSGIITVIISLFL